MTRLHQIELQRRGLSGMTDQDIAAVLKLTAEQDQSIKKILEDTDKEQARSVSSGGTKSSLGEPHGEGRRHQEGGVLRQDSQAVLTAGSEEDADVLLNGEPVPPAASLQRAAIRRRSETEGGKDEVMRDVLAGACSMPCLAWP